MKVNEEGYHEFWSYDSKITVDASKTSSESNIFSKS